jgi:glycosyltransferase involved in cell wall biosynthesis
MRIGIALATFNGEEFLAEQLQSIRGQRRLPNEMLVVDDASSDRTWEMLHEFQRTAPFEVTLFQNAVRQGPKASFLRAMDACRSEAIAFCDQDDMWREDKLAVCEDILAKRGARLVVH